MNTYWIIPGRLAAGEYPGALHRPEAAAKLRTLLGAGIDCFIDLTKPADRLAPYAGIAVREASRLGMEIVHERHPIVDMSVPDTRRQMADILDAIDSALSDGKSPYVHCWGGCGRTGTVVGCWLVRHGMTGEQALNRIARWWRGMEKVTYLPHSPQTREQCDYVRNWVEPGRQAAG